VIAPRTRSFPARRLLRFEGLAESPARLWPRHDGHIHGYLGTVECPRTRETRTLDDCVHCQHFVNVRPDPGGHTALLRCLCNDDDALVEPGTATGVCTVAPELPVDAARVLASTHAAEILVVIVDDLVVGALYPAALTHARGVVAEHMIDEPWSLPADATIGDAVDALRELRAPALLVIDADARLVGVIGAADLRRLGVPEELLPG
jgi:hypothetical protein